MLKLRFNLVADAGILPEWQHHSFLPNSNHSTVEGGSDEESSMTDLLTPERLGGLFRGNERCFGDIIVRHHSFLITPSINKRDVDCLS